MPGLFSGKVVNFLYSCKKCLNFSNTLNIFSYPLSQAPLFTVVHKFCVETRLAGKTLRPENGMIPV